ncbi:hypothetical protein C8R44DRAFT_904133, partial [Mycena epipterygia]
SQVVKTALVEYNLAAATLVVPRPALGWEQVVEYTFLADFDLLREGSEDIREEPWAKPVGRLAMDQYFKLRRADEEIQRLNVEIPRFLTYMRDEEDFLWREEQHIRCGNGPVLAYQIGKYRMRQGRFNDDHRDRLTHLSRFLGFSASLLGNGTPVDKQRLEVVPENAAVLELMSMPMPIAPQPAPLGDDDDSDDDDLADTLAEHFVVLSVTEDRGQLQDSLHTGLREVLET